MAFSPINFLANRLGNTNDASPLLERIVSSSGANNRALLSLIDSLSPGETLLGKVLSSSESTLTILTSENVLVEAGNEAKIDLKPGQKVMFEVHKGLNNEISLRPLYENTNMNKTCESALKEAGIPINDRSIEMTVRMMEYGKKIDINSLQKMYKTVVDFPDSSVKSLVDLTHMEISVTKSNISAYNDFVSQNNELTAKMFEVSEAIGNDFKSLFLKADFESVQGSIDFSLAVKDFLEATSDNVPVVLTGNEKEALIDKLEQFQIDAAPLKELPDNADGKTVLESTFKALENSLNKDDSGVYLELSSDKPQNPKALIFDDPVIKNLILRSCAERLLEASTKLPGKEELTKFYEGLKSDVNRLVSFSNKNVSVLPEVNATVSSMSENLSFSDALNNYVPYVQVPFKNDGSEKTGDLYVYRRKREAGNEGGPLTAFLHLDMENLGPTDVKVSLDGNHVSTNFTFRDDETLELVEQHLDFLNKRLKEKGFSASLSVETSKDLSSPLEKVINDNTPKIPMSDTSFDARI